MNDSIYESSIEYTYIIIFIFLTMDKLNSSFATYICAISTSRTMTSKDSVSDKSSRTRTRLPGALDTVTAKA